MIEDQEYNDDSCTRCESGIINNVSVEVKVNGSMVMTTANILCSKHTEELKDIIEDYLLGKAS